MAKILTWNDISSTYVNRGTLTQCPSYNMVSSSVKDGYQIQSSSTTVPTQLLTDISFKSTLGALNIQCSTSDTTSTSEWVSVRVNILGYTPVEYDPPSEGEISLGYTVYNWGNEGGRTPVSLNYSIPIGETVNVVFSLARYSSDLGMESIGYINNVWFNGYKTGTSFEVTITGTHSMVAYVGSSRTMA